MKKMIMVMVSLVAASVVGEGINDALVYDMVLVPTNGPVTTANIYNRLTHSSASRVNANSVSTFSGSTNTCGTPAPITIAEETVEVPGVEGVSYVEPVLTFPQSTAYVGTNYYSFHQGIKLTNVPASSNMTIYCRMCLDPSAATDDYNGGLHSILMDFDWTSGNNSSTAPFGCRLQMQSQYGYNFFVFDYDYYGNKQFIGYVNQPKASTGKWFDLVFVLETKGEDLGTENEGTTMRLYARYSGKEFGRASCGDYSDETRPFLLPFSFSGYKFGKVLKFRSQNVSIGAPMSYVGNTGWTGISNNKLKDRQDFRGKISRFRVYNRPFTTQEARGLLSEANGGAVLVGRNDGTASECAAEDDAGAAEVYKPYTMPSSKMRGVLTAAHPTLTIECPPKVSELGLCKVLSLKPILGALGAGTAELEVAVNGTALGRMTLADAQEANFYVGGSFVQTNANGVIRYTLTRRGDLAGAIGIDSLVIAGSWGEGMHHVDDDPDPSGVFRTAGYEKQQTYVGHPCATNYMMSCLFGPSAENGTIYKPVTMINFYVPEGIALNRDTAYTFGFRYADYTLKDVFPMLDLYLNGVKKGGSLHMSPWYTPFTWQFPAGTLRPGYNSLTVSNATPVEV
ncbi:MAG TPA: hypothetical protein PKI32_09290, partial [Opitutales bacterium]|nr:hypothetical protein [Opitutales bacterium]